MTSLSGYKLPLLVALSGFVFLSSLTAQPAFPQIPQPEAAPIRMPPIPVVQPVESFRELLKMSPAERENELTNHPPKIRERILAKVREYEAMTPEEREMRLRMTEVHWYFLQFMKTTPDQRTMQLAAVPDADRKLLSDRLKLWDNMSVNERQAISKYLQTMEILDAHRWDPVTATNEVIASMPTAARSNLDNFLKLPPEQRQQMYASFQRFFELNEDEKQSATATLPPYERQQLKNLGKRLALMPRNERADYMKGLTKFLKMSNAEQEEFMKNAHRWQDLTPAERQAWRDLLNGLPPTPPLPPGFAYPPMPPMPPLPQQVDVPSSLARPQQ